MNIKVLAFLQKYLTVLRAWFGRVIKPRRPVKFRQIMGWIIIIRTFNPLLLLLALVLIAFLTVRDIRAQLQPSLNEIKTGYHDVTTELKTVKGSIDTMTGTFNSLKDTLNGVGGVIGQVGAFINDKIIGVLNASHLFNIAPIRISLSSFIPNFDPIFAPFKSLSQSMDGMFSGVNHFFADIGKVLADLWARLKMVIILALVWALITIFANMYSEVNRGLDLIRGPREMAANPAAVSAVKYMPVETPPTLILSCSTVTTPVLLDIPEAQQKPGRPFVYQERHLLSAMGVWPDRAIPMLYHQLADQVNPGVWLVFWEGMRSLGFDLSQVKVVVTDDGSAVSSTLGKYLPGARLEKSLDAAGNSGQLGESTGG
jgi:hypothetical protein